MHLLLIIRRTHLMSIHNLIAERKNQSLKIHLIFHLVFLEMKRVNILTSHLPLYIIHEIMRMPTNTLNVMIMVIVIFVLLHLIKISIHSMLICLSHWYFMIYLLTK